MKFLFALLVAVLSCFALASADDVCLLEKAKNGNGVIQCMGYMPMWTYDVDTNECVQFIYGGCQGNANRFESEQLCRQVCVS